MNEIPSNLPTKPITIKINMKKTGSHSTSILTATMLGASVIAGHGATFSLGYTKGPDSQLLVANGGAGAILFHDSAAVGGNQDPNDPSGTAAFNSALLPGTGLWSIGDIVNVTGVAFVLRAGTNSGTITIDVRQAVGGTGPSGAGGLASIATRNITYTATSTSTVWAEFDTPVTFVADANSTTIGLHISNSGGQLNLKAGSDNTDGLVRYNFSNGNIVGGATPSFQRWSVAGSVIPEPSVALLGAFGLLALMRRRRA